MHSIIMSAFPSSTKQTNSHLSIHTFCFSVHSSVDTGFLLHLSYYKHCCYSYRRVSKDNNSWVKSMRHGAVVATRATWKMWDQHAQCSDPCLKHLLYSAGPVFKIWFFWHNQLYVTPCYFRQSSATRKYFSEHSCEIRCLGTIYNPHWFSWWRKDEGVTGCLKHPSLLVHETQEAHPFPPIDFSDWRVYRAVQDSNLF